MGGAAAAGGVQWENTENKTAVLLYGVGALVALWFSSTIVGAVNAVPVVPLPPPPRACLAHIHLYPDRHCAQGRALAGPGCTRSMTKTRRPACWARPSQHMDEIHGCSKFAPC